VDAVSQVLGEAALRDRAYAEATWARVRAARQALRDGLVQIGLAPAESQSNFLLAHVPPGSKRSARELYEYLRARHVLVRHFDAPRLDDRLRISVGTPDQNQRLIAVLEEALHG